MQTDRPYAAPIWFYAGVLVLGLLHAAVFGELTRSVRSVAAELNYIAAEIANHGAR